jgi:predicted RNA binding protein YcfA (HicA-like mRNA interferase family)
MNTVAKLPEAMRANPSGWRIEQLQTIAKRLGIQVRCTDGSHHVFPHPAVTEALSVTARQQIKPAYIRAFTLIADKVRELEE